MKKYNIIFMGTPKFSVPSLLKLSKLHNIKAVFTKKPKKSGRGMKLTNSPVNIIAKKIGIKCFYPDTLCDNRVFESINLLNCHIIVVVAYGLKLPQSILKKPKFGCLNAHASLLPKWRGAAPIHRAIEAGDKKTGVSSMLMTEKMDSGPVFNQIKMNILPSMNFIDVYEKLSFIASDVLVKTINNIENSKPIRQDINSISYAKKITKSDAELNLDMNANYLVRKIRAFCSFPGCYIQLKNNRLKVLSATAENISSSEFPPGFFLGKNRKNKVILSCGENTNLILDKVQPENKKIMLSHDFLNGSNWVVGKKII